MSSGLFRVFGLLFFCFVVAISFGSQRAFSQTQSTVCAIVKIEIQQELTIERQAFEATLNIENVLADKTISNIRVVVDFQDENGNPVVASSDPNDTNASFFIRVNNLDGIDSVDGSGELDGGKKAKITWLIIPAPGASDGIPSGKLYFVGASFQYELDGVADSIEVAPDTIFVRPLPLLSLDYFLPRDVFADNPLTSSIEPIEPFTLGVRVQNNGQGAGKNIKIESAQPRIVENKQGLLIDFRLLNSFVQNEPVNNSLLIEFGDIPSGESKIGRWNMETSLSGRFTEFSAEYSHADELGGQLTSLLESVNTHTLVRDVLVDLPGRDNVKDFLAYNIFDPLSDSLFGLKVYESDSTTSIVEDQSGAASLSSSGSGYQVELEPNPGFVYAKFDDPFDGGKSIAKVVRDDGKVLSLNNVWFSKSYNRASKDISYHFNIFDVGTSGKYQIEFRDPVAVPRKPVIQFVPLRQTFEGGSLSFVIEASDPDGTMPQLSLLNPPAGVIFVDQGDGIAQFSWTPTTGQAGRYDFNVIANDGQLTSQRQVSIIVNSASDIDGDGILDSYELENFGNLSRDGQSDSDGDGVSDFDEFERGTDPNTTDGPLAPKILEPLIEGFVQTKQPELIVENSEYVGEFNIVYEYELYSDANFTDLVDAYYAQPEDESGETAFKTKELEEDSDYFWRVRAFDSFTYSPWVNGGFKVNSENSLPPVPKLNYPENNAEVFIDQLKLVINTVVDPDQDQLFYKFFLFEDELAQNLISESSLVAQPNAGQLEWFIPVSLEEGRTYYWRAEVVDIADEPISTEFFSFNLGVSNRAPDSPTIDLPVQGAHIETAMPELVVIDAVDQDQSDGLSYYFEVDESVSFDSTNKISSGWLLDNDSEPEFRWQLNSELNEDQQYFWRVKARDSQSVESGWNSSDFIVNAVNEPPAVPVIKNPGENSQVITSTPKLEVFASSDPDGDQVSYVFELYADGRMQQLLFSEEAISPELIVAPLEDDTWFYWRVKAQDSKGLESDWTPLVPFFVNENNVDNVPEFTWLTPEKGTEIIQGQSIILRWQDRDPDSSAKISLFYADNPDGVGRTILASDISEDEDGLSDQMEWSSRGLTAGNYYFFAVIEDASNVTAVAAEPVFNVVVNAYRSRPIRAQSVTGNGIPNTLPFLTDFKYFNSWRHWSNNKSVLEFDFGEIKRLDRIETAFENSRLVKYRYSFEASEDGVSWNLIVNNRESARRFWSRDNQFNAQNARYVRLMIHSANTEWNFFGRKNIVPVRLKRIREVLFKGGIPFSE